MSNNQYPKYQWSYFVDGDRNQQLVYRTDDWDEFLAEVKKIKGALAGKKKAEPDAYGKAMTGQKCNKCGAEMINNPKTGKWFCKEKCWLK